MNGLENVDKVLVQGQHLLADIFGIEDPRLSDPSFFVSLLKDMAKALNQPLLNEPQINAVDNQATTGFLLLKNGNISCHCLPPAGFLAIDILIFGEASQGKDPENALTVVTNSLNSQMIRKTTITRGFQS